MPVLLEVEGLTVRYGHVEAVRGIDLGVDEGELLTLVGANGAGKTSTLLALSGLVPAGGRVRFLGEELTRMPAHRRVAMGLVQVPEGRAILGRMSVEENLLLGGRLQRDAPSLLGDVYHRFPVLGERRHGLAGQLSGGEQQMLALGRALMARPRLLMLDEPSMGLAPRMVASIFAAIADINRQGTSVLLVEQNVRQALTLARNGLVLEGGRVAVRGAADELLQDPRVVAAYLGG